METKKKHLWVYVVFLFILFVDISLNRYFGKLYPSLVFSLFSEVPEIEEKFDVDTRQVYAVTTANDTVEVDQALLFQTESPLKLGVIIDKLIKKEQEKALHQQNEPQREQFKTYVKQQLQEQKPAEAYNSLMVIKYKRTFDARTSSFLDQDTSSRQQIIIELR